MLPVLHLHKARSTIRESNLGFFSRAHVCASDVFLVLRIVRHKHGREHKKEHKNGHSGAQENYRVWASFLVLIFVLWIAFLVLRTPDCAPR